MASDNDLKPLLQRLVACWLVLGELPQFVAFLEMVRSVMAEPATPLVDQAVVWFVAVVKGAVIPWWIEPLSWLSRHGVLAMLFLVAVVKYDLWDPS